VLGVKIEYVSLFRNMNNEHIEPLKGKWD